MKKITPNVFFGTMMKNELTYDSMITAFKAGYTHFDFAYIYQNLDEVGRAIKDWFESNPNSKRENYFFQTKIWTTFIENNSTRKTFQAMLQSLNLNYIDSVLLHRPTLSFAKCIYAWNELISIKKQGLIKVIGVSNYDKDHILYLWAHTTVKPQINQIEFNAVNQRWDRVNFCQKNNIAVQGYSTMHKALSSKTLNNLAETKRIPVANLISNWMLKMGISPVLKSTNEVHIYKNLDYRNVQINSEDILKIYNLNRFDNLFPESFDEPEMSRLFSSLKS